MVGLPIQMQLNYFRMEVCCPTVINNNNIIFIETRFADHPLVSSVVLDIKEDFRHRYFKHAIFNISWKQPTSTALFYL